MLYSPIMENNIPVLPDEKAAAISRPDGADYVHIHNRKYLGSKHRLLDFLKEIIFAHVPEIHTFIDAFAGTGVVGCCFSRYAEEVIANDLLYSNYVILHTFLNSQKEQVAAGKIGKIIADLNCLEGKRGYISANFAGTYFTEENAGLIDAIREQITFLYENRECTREEKYVLLTSLLFAVDKIANTVGQYDAFLRNMGKECYSQSGKHLTDSNVHKRITLKIPAFHYSGKNQVYAEDINQLIKRIKGDVLYLDPPYNHRQYIDCYHLPENIVLWKKPPLSGITGKFAREHLKSEYSRRNKAPQAFKALIENADVGHIFLSYNNEGIIPDDMILEVLNLRGTVKIYEQPYTVFGNGAGVSVKRKITERIFYCKVKNR